jgi:hypothetical protein
MTIDKTPAMQQLQDTLPGAKEEIDENRLLMIDGEL